jgi:pyruvate/2-oxoglutarate/acetoin dehydrogenase E1 component
MALRGLRPVVEIMFGDFLALAADQLINHAAKFKWMYNQRTSVPLVLRTPMGGRRGYGPTHSQTLEKIFMGVPGLRVIAPSVFGDPGALLRDAILDSDEPVLFVENKLLYLQQLVNSIPQNELEVEVQLLGHGKPPTYRVVVRGAPKAALTITAYGHMASLAAEAISVLAYEHEIFAELIVITGLTPVDLGAVLESTRQSGYLLAAEEGSLTLGWSAEVIARTAEALGADMKGSARVAARDLPIAASKTLENAQLPDISDLVSAARKLARAGSR